MIIHGTEEKSEKNTKKAQKGMAKHLLGEYLSSKITRDYTVH